MAQIRILSDKPTPRISTTFSYIKVKSAFGLDELDRGNTHSAGTLRATTVASSASTRTRQERSAIPITEPCFITNRPAYGLRKAHWVNAVRGDKARKKDVENFLQQLGVVPDNFNLNSASNLTPLDSNMHYFLDHLSFFAVTCSKTTLQAMIKEVEAENKIYDSKRPRHYTRDFNLSQAPFSTATYEMVVLHPKYFLPLGSPMVACVQDPNATSNVVAKLYVIGPDGALRESPGNGPRFPAFPGPARPAPAEPMDKDNRLNPFLVILNAEMAFRRFMRIKPNPPAIYAEYQELINLTIKLADLIYHKPLVNSAMSVIHSPIPTQVQGAAMQAEDQNAMQGVTELGVITGGGGGVDSATPKARGYGGRGRNVAGHAPDAPEKDPRVYFSTLMSARGRDVPISKDSQDALAELGLLQEEDRALLQENKDDDDDDDEDEDDYEYEDDDDEDEDGKVVVGHGGPVPYNQKVQQWQASAIAP